MKSVCLIILPLLRFHIEPQCSQNIVFGLLNTVYGPPPFPWIIRPAVARVFTISPHKGHVFEYSGSFIVMLISSHLLFQDLYQDHKSKNTGLVEI